jgi:DNA-binding transcriptional LysR family regulator
MGKQIDLYMRSCHPDIDCSFEFDATDPLLGLVREGLGFALTTPLCLWQSRHHSKSVRLLPLSTFRQLGKPYPPMTRHFELVYRQGELGSLPRAGA